ncbi:MAG: hypothetical protein D6B26_05550 [Spirochaetaceae bacterium]|nr:MAG: hypothetical protein D6B26_05550 [Spirochaetaceae bacterium]
MILLGQNRNRIYPSADVFCGLHDRINPRGDIPAAGASALDLADDKGRLPKRHQRRRPLGRQIHALLGAFIGNALPARGRYPFKNSALTHADLTHADLTHADLTHAAPVPSAARLSAWPLTCKAHAEVFSSCALARPSSITCLASLYPDSRSSAMP